MQMMALQEQLEEIENQTLSIDHSVKDVQQGQQNDRLRLYYSGVALYLETRTIDDPDLRRALLIQAMSPLSDAFEFIHQAAMLRAGIYCEQND